MFCIQNMIFNLINLQRSVQQTVSVIKKREKLKVCCSRSEEIWMDIGQPRSYSASHYA